MFPCRNRYAGVVLSLAAATAIAACRSEAHRRGEGLHGGVASSPIDLRAFPGDPAVAAHILRMSFAEAATRLGSLSFEARTFFVFNRAGVDREQTHIGRVTQDASGNFYVLSDTGPSQVELYLVGDSVYVRQDKGHLRHKARPEAVGAWRDLVWSSLRESLGLFAPHLRFIDARDETAAGRLVWRYRIALAPEGEPGIPLPPASPSLPLSPTSRWRELARPLSATGSLWLDAATGVPMRLKLDGRLEVADRDVRPTQLTVRYDGAVSSAGRVKPISPPESIPELERTPPVEDPISFFRPELEAASPLGTAERAKTVTPR
jgi:hypothetical protein